LPAHTRRWDCLATVRHLPASKVHSLAPACLPGLPPGLPSRSLQGADAPRGSRPGSTPLLLLLGAPSLSLRCKPPHLVAPAPARANCAPHAGDCRIARTARALPPAVSPSRPPCSPASIAVLPAG